MNSLFFPSAQISYADNYSVKVEKQQLNSIAKPGFTTHRDSTAEKLHQASQFLILPWRKSIQMIGKALQPCPGANKDKPSIWHSRPICILRGTAGFLGLLISIAIMILTSPVHLMAAMAYRSRPVMGYIDNSFNIANGDLKLSTHHVQVRTHNLGFIVETLSNTGDLRPVCERAQGVVDSVRNDRYQPDLILFQEAFHEDGTRILCEGLKTTYPYMLTNVLPTASGFNSGTLVMSKYPILESQFHCLDHNLGIERLSPKGMIRFKIQTTQGPLHIYGTHTQALLGKERAEARFKQLEQMHKIMEDDYRADSTPQLLMGDLNTSTVTAWGENNISDGNNPEKRVQEKLTDLFVDLFLSDHDALTGIRTSGKAQYLESDNHRMGVNLPEPEGSWYIGPFAQPNTLLAAGVIKKIEQDRRKHNYGVPVVAGKAGSLNAPTWGTDRWRSEQPANTARFDYILVPKYCRSLEGRAEIRRGVVAAAVQSADTDHLPVDATIIIKGIK